MRSLSWKQTGTISLWRYKENPRNYPGWHLTADSAGCASLLTLLDAFTSDGIAASRTLTLSAPTEAILAVPGNRTTQWISASKLRLTLTNNASQWAFPEAVELAELTFGFNWLSKLYQGIEGISQGAGDFSMGCPNQNNQSLWFWWQP